MEKQKFKRGDICISDRICYKDKEFIILYSSDELMDTKPMVENLIWLDCNTMKWHDNKNIDDKIKMTSNLNINKKYQYHILQIDYLNKHISGWAWMDQDGLTKTGSISEKGIKDMYESNTWENYTGKYEEFLLISPKKVEVVKTIRNYE